MIPRSVPRAGVGICTVQAAVVTGGWLYIMVAAPGGRHAAVGSVGILLVVSVITAMSAAIAAHRGVGRDRIAWGIAILLAVLNVGGCCVVIAGDLGGASLRTPITAQLLFEASVVPGVAAVVSMTPRFSAGLKQVLDMLIALCSIVIVAWLLFARQLYTSLESRPDTAAIAPASVALSVVGVAIFFGVLLGVIDTTRARRAMLILILVELLVFATTNASISVLVSRGTYRQGSPIDIGFAIAMTLLGCASWTVPTTATRAVERRIDAAWKDYFAYGCATLALIVGAVEFARGATFDRALVAVAMLFAVLVLTRQGIAFGENRSLARSLDDRNAELARTAERFEALVQNSTDIIVLVESDGTVLYSSPAFARLLGVQLDGVVQRSIGDLVIAPDRERVLREITRITVGNSDWTIEDVAGRRRHMEVVISDLRGLDAVGAILINGRDVSDRRTQEEGLRHQALHDPLTGLANRVLFTDRLEHAMAAARRSHHPVSLLFVDLDDFKAINDDLGHQAGDRVLVEVGARLAGVVRDVDSVARLGGDEFAIVLEQAEAAGAEEVARRVLAALEGPMVSSGSAVRVSGSVGVATSEEEQSAAELIARSDAAMYQAKAQGKGRMVCHGEMSA